MAHTSTAGTSSRSFARFWCLPVDWLSLPFRRWSAWAWCSHAGGRRTIAPGNAKISLTHVLATLITEAGEKLSDAGRGCARWRALCC